jgi:hypothetical protein
VATDHAEVLRRLKGHIASKRSHGQRDLLCEIGRLEAACSHEEDAYHRFIARFGEELGEAFLNAARLGGETGAAGPLTGTAASAPAMAPAAPPSIAPRGTKEDACQVKEQERSSASASAPERAARTAPPRSAAVAR